MTKRIAPFLIVVFFAVTSFWTAAASEYTSLGLAQIDAMVPTATRTVIDLSGTWQVVRNGVAETSVFVPGPVESTEPVLLRRAIRIEAGALTRNTWHLSMLGVIDEVEVRVNGRFVMRYPGGMVPFSIRVPDAVLLAGTNTVELVLSPTSELTARVERFARASRRRNMGILREVLLVGTPHVWTNDVKVRTTLDSHNGRMRVAATIMGGVVERLAGGGSGGDALAQGRTQVTVEALLTSKNGIVVARSGGSIISIERARQQVLNFDLAVANPQRWSVQQPNTYQLTIRIEREGVLVDEYATSVGFRSVRVVSNDRGRVIAVNDTVLNISAIDYVDAYPQRGTSMSWKQMERDVSIMKTLGINVVRVRHGSPHPYFLSLCDKYGLMVMAELPAFDIPTDIIEQDEIFARQKNSTERTIAFLDSHPSVIALGLSDGLEEGSSAVQQFHAGLVKLFRLHSSKLLYKVVSAGLTSVASEGGFDIVVVSFLSSKDRTRFDDMVKLLPRTFRSSAVLTLFGSVLSPENTRGFSDPLSNEAQAMIIRDRYRATMGAGLAGVVVWSFADYQLERPTMLVDHYDAYTCTAGLLDEWRQPRIAYSMLKSLINDEKEPLLQARDASFDTPLIFIASGIVIALIMAFLINRSRRFREYLIRAIARPYNFYADIRDQRILSVGQTGTLGVVISGCAGLVLASLFYYVRTDAEIEYLLHVMIPSNSMYEVVRYVAWRPIVAVPLWSGVVAFLLIGTAFFLRASAIFVKPRIYLRDTITIVVWSALPLVVLLPVGIALYQALSTHALSFWVPVLVLFLAGWSMARTMRASSVVFDIPSALVYTIGLGIVVLGFAFLLIMWNATYDAFSFIRFYMNVVSA